MGHCPYNSLWSKHGPRFALVNELSWETFIAIQLHIVCGCFSTVIAKLYSCD